MNKNRLGNYFARAALATGAALTLNLASGVAAAADTDKHEDRAEMRIKDLHARLKITPAQEDQWKKVVQVMEEDAHRMDTLTQARVDHGKTMTAVDDLKSYEEITESHATGIKKLVDAFEPLYAGMSPAQKTEADNLFRHGGRTAPMSGEKK